MPDIEAFGTTSEGETVGRVEIAGGGLTARVLTWGAIVQDLRLHGHDSPLVLGFERFEDYWVENNYFGAVAGRHANRIRDGRFEIDGEAYAIDGDAPERQGLHGGRIGYARRNWTVAAFGPDFVTLGLIDPDGTMGFPGTIEAKCTYRLREPGCLSVEMTATTDRPTLCNLAQHSYFNLEDGGRSDVLDHFLTIEADAFLPVDDAMIPTGEVRPVVETIHDFRRARTIRPPMDHDDFLYDHNFCLASARAAPRQVARAKAPTSGVEMTMWTTEPGIQFYAGHLIKPQRSGLDGRVYRKYAGFCLEAQTWPDSPNRPYFAQAVLRPGEEYHQVTEFRFRKS